MTYSRRIRRFHVKPWQAWLLILVLTTFPTTLLLNSLLTSNEPLSPGPAQVPHFVCTADGDGTIMRCVFSTIVPPQNSPLR